MRICRNVVLTALGLTLLLAAPLRAAEVDSYLPSDAEVVWTINVQQLLGSPVVKQYALDFIKSALKDNQEVKGVLDALGFDPLKDITTVTGASASMEAKSEKGLIIVHGKFDLAKFQSKAEEAAKTEGGVLKIHTVPGGKIYEINPPDDKQTMFVALLDAGTIVASPGKDYVIAALEKKAGKGTGSIKKELADLLAKADPKQSISFVAMGSIVSRVPIGDPQKNKEAADKIKSITGGVQVTDDVKADFVLAAKDANAAKELSQGVTSGVQQIKGFIGLLAASQPELAPLVDVANTIKVAAQGTDVNIAANITKELIEKAAKGAGK